MAQIPKFMPLTCLDVVFARKSKENLTLLFFSADVSVAKDHRIALWLF